MFRGFQKVGKRKSRKRGKNWSLAGSHHLVIPMHYQKNPLELAQDPKFGVNCHRTHSVEWFLPWTWTWCCSVFTWNLLPCDTTDAQTPLPIHYIITRPSQCPRVEIKVNSWVLINEKLVELSTLLVSSNVGVDRAARHCHRALCSAASAGYNWPSQLGIDSIPSPGTHLNSIYGFNLSL